MKMFIKVTGLLFFITVAAGIFLFDSCKKDSDSGPVVPVNEPDYYFEYLTQKYEIGKCIVKLDTSVGWVDKHLYHIYLTSVGVEYDALHNRLVGDGNGLLFDLVTLTDTSFAGAGFAVHPEHIIPEIRDIRNPRLMLNGDFSLMNGEIIPIGAGNSVIGKIGNLCQVSFNFVSTANDSITGRFSGYYELY